jgi:ubiquinone/menaquinone biosynthesis C-methylase UbiE
MMIAADLQSIFWCPSCQAGSITSDVTVDRQSELRCVACDARYPVATGGFPQLFPRGTMVGDDWNQWSEHLDKFQERRDARIDNPGWIVNRFAARSQPQPSFGKFIGIDEGTVLDVGCGPGKFRFQLDPSKVRYVGLDPIALPGVDQFPFVQGLAEYLPFKDRTFTDIVVLAALDHFRDLDRFLSESRRVLVENGRLHIMQSTHEVRGPISAVKVIVHKAKDALEDGLSARHGRDVPKHLSEFTSTSLVERIGRAFEVAATETYSATWYSPDKRFLTFVPKAGRAAGSDEQRAELTS